jgi:hypothetical protein
MRLRNLVFLLPLSLLAACAPKLEATRVLERVVSITNKDSRSVTLTRIVANGEDGNSNCNVYPHTSLAPGESYQTTFILCGNVASLRVETDVGNAALNF